jgi:glycosyltransferase involved in cell wall biosynthesis
MPVRICTIIARNYLPAARVLATSFLDHHPSGHVAVLIIDDVRGDVDPHDEPFEVVRSQDLDLETGEFHRMAMIYGLVELATALKPWLLRHLLSRPDTQAVMYLDPDIRVYAPLDEVSALAEAEGIVLTPHVTSPIPRDGKMTDENTILSAGMYNLGFIAVGAQAQPFLDFWMARLARECRVDVSKNRFVDQRWIDFVPSVFGGKVLRDPSYNVAYWNLEHRDLRWTDRGYRVDGLPLHFFHFSGFDVAAPSLLSKWQGARPRVLLSERPDLARICGEYQAAIRAATRGGESATRYGFADLPNGVPIDGELRELYRERLEGAETAGTPLPPDPFTAGGAEDLLEWARSPSGEAGHRAPRYLEQILSRRARLRDAFPAPHGPDYDALLDWAEREVAAGRLDRRLIPSLRLAPAEVPPGVRWAPPGRLTPGLSVVTDAPAGAGTGSCAGLLAAAAQAAGIETETVVLEAFGDPPRLRPGVPGTGRHNVNLIAVGPAQWDRFMEDAGPAFFDGRYTIGFLARDPGTTDEAAGDGLGRLDEVWTTSDPVGRSVERLTANPVLSFSPPVVAPTVPPDADRGKLGLPGGFLFLSRLDFRFSLEHADPSALVEAFDRAFPPGEGPILVFAASGAPSGLAELEELKLLAAGRPDVLVMDREMDAGESAALTAACDCYVTLDPGQLSGLAVAEAVSLGKPVILADDPSGPDLLDAATAYLVPLSAADPPVDAIAHLLRRVVAHPEEARQMGERARDAALTTRGPAARAGFIRERFDHAQKVLLARAAAPRAALDLRSLVELAGSRADAGGPSRISFISRPLRRIVARVTAHGDAHRALVDTRLAEALLALTARVDEIDRRMRVTVDEPGHRAPLRPGHSGSPPDSGPSTGATQTAETDGVPPRPSLKVTT